MPEPQVKKEEHAIQRKRQLYLDRRPKSGG